ncbi:MAG: hypothetical protein ACPHUK_00415 [Candidatus Poseidoniaceae archaeon]
MQTNRRNERLAESGERVTLHGLRLVGEGGKARASLTDSRVSFEFKNGNCLEFRYDSIARMHHHNTTLVPAWIAFVGLCALYASWRIITPADLRVFSFLAGVILISSWGLTKRPTLTLDMNLGDCHVIYGNDSKLLEFSMLIQRINEGMTLEEAKIGTEMMNQDTDYPREAAHEAYRELPTPPVDLVPSASITAFLRSETPSNEGFEIDEETIPRWANDVINQAPPSEHGLIARGREHVSTRRGYQTQEIQSQHNPIGEIDAIFTGETPLPPEGEVHRGSSSQRLQQARELALARQPRTTATLPQARQSSFVSPEGAHIPHSSGMFTSPDHHLENFGVEEVEEAPSLFEQAFAPVEQPKTQPQPALKSGIIRKNRGNNSLKRIQVRSNQNENKIVKSKKSRTSIVSRGISNTMRKVRNKITDLSGDGVDDELIEHMHGHIREEDSQEVPQSFSSLTESQEVMPIQQSGRHGLRRFD